MWGVAEGSFLHILANFNSLLLLYYLFSPFFTSFFLSFVLFFVVVVLETGH